MAYGARKGSAQTFEDISLHETLACCLVCMESHDKPTQLDCKHIFCEQCLLHRQKLHCKETNTPERGTFIACPTCQQLTEVPSSGGIGALSLEKKQIKTQSRVRKVSVVGDMITQRCEPCIYKTKIEEAEYYCNKCLLNFCQQCKHAHDQHSVFNSHSMIHISNKDAVNLYCSQHGKHSSLYFCNDCNKPACAVCVMQDHTSHQTINLVDALSIRRSNLKQCLNTVGPKAEKMSMKLRKLIQTFSNHTNHKMKNGSNHSSTESISKVKDDEIEMKLNPRKDSNDNVDYETRTMERELKRIHKLYEQSSKITEMSQSRKLLIVYDELINRLQTVINVDLEHIQEQLALKLEREIETTMSQPLNGKITPSVSSGSIQEKVSKTDTSNKSSPQHSIISIDDGYDHSDHYMLFKPKLLWKVEKQRSEVSDLLNPSGIAFQDSGEVVVAEYDVLNDKNNRLRIFNSSGGIKGMITHPHMKPLGVAINREGQIAITDCEGAKRIKVFTPEGHLHHEIGKGHFGWPYGIVCNSKGQYIVSDTFHDTISIFSRDGKQKIKTFGSSGPEKSQFKNPFHVSVDSHDNIVISDSGNRCVKIFDVRGEFMYISSESYRRPSHDIVKRQKRRRLKGPRGIAVDIRDNILVADDSGKICLFDSSGRYIRNLLTDEDSIKYPEALAANKQGYLAVTEWNPNNMYAIKIFSMYE